uniref:AraC family transcriptional regulator n=1 Tax=Gordonia sp. B7-2 TaxID=3420932 RepID=UPI003D919C91
MTDSAGIWVPTEMLGGNIAAGDTVLPIAPDTPLTRSCASLVARLAGDVAVGGVDVDLDTELAAIELVRAVIEQGRKPSRSAEDPDVLRGLISDLVDRGFRDPGFGAASVARQLHMSKRQLDRSLEGFGLSLSEMITERRLELAQALLAGSERVRLEGIARSVGFPSAAKLRNRFRARHGITPDEYRRSVAAAGSAEEQCVRSEA